MRTYVLFSHLPFLAAATCGGGGGGGPAPAPDAAIDAPVADAPPPDAPPGNAGGLEHIDWRTTRGAPIASHAVNVPGAGGDLFAVTGNGFVTQAGCDDPRGCSLTWRDLAGSAGVQIAHSTRATVTSVSPDGKRAALIATDAIETCNDAQGAFQVVRGTLKLLDLATGAASFELPLRSNTWSVQGFTPFSDFLFAAPIKGTACLADALGWLAASAPFKPPLGLATSDSFIQAIDPQRWIVQRSNGALGTLNPNAANSFQPFGDKSPSSFDVTQGWTHTYTGFADLAQDVVSTSPAGVKHATSLHDNDWHAAGARGRWFRVCGQPQVEGFRNCRAIDGQGERAGLEFRVTLAPDHGDDAVVLGDGAVVFTGPLDDGSRAIQRIDLATGKRDVLHTGNGSLQALGDGAGAILLLDGAAWYIEAAHEERVADHVSQVVAAPQLPFLRRPVGRQDAVALVVTASDNGQLALAILDARTRRLARVTDNVFVNQPAGAPFSFANTCGQPWTTHNAGTNHIEGLVQSAQSLFFVERTTPATMWLLPIDLSSPPRKLGEVVDPASCHAPLVSPDGHRIGFAETDGAATRIVLSN